MDVIDSVATQLVYMLFFILLVSLDVEVFF